MYMQMCALKRWHNSLFIARVVASGITHACAWQLVMHVPRCQYDACGDYFTADVLLPLTNERY